MISFSYDWKKDLLTIIAAAFCVAVIVISFEALVRHEVHVSETPDVAEARKALRRCIDKGMNAHVETLWRGEKPVSWIVTCEKNK